MADPTPLEPAVQTCLNCAALIDVSEEDPFQTVHCPMCGTAMRVHRSFNNYSLMEVLGSGGMGTVYRALDTHLNREVALKVLKKEYSGNGEFVRKLEREAMITASINHPHVVKVFSSGTSHGQFYLAMELVDKGSLDDLMTLQKRIAEIQALTIGIQIAQGLDAACHKGLIHSDVKPGNILFADQGTAKIVDFGLAELMEEEAVSKGEVWGTPYYVSPERLNRQQEDFRSDMYSLGATLFHAIAGRPPFEAETASLVALRHIRSRAVSLQAFAPDVSSETAYVINRMVKREPDERYASYAELVDHLKYARSKIEEHAGKAHRQRARVVMETKESQKFAAYLTLGVLGVVVILGLVLALNWKRIMGGEDVAAPSKTPAPSARAVAADPGQVAFEDAREALEAAKFGEALEMFRSMRKAGPLKQPLRNWAILHEGLTLLFLDRFSEAKPLFKSLEEGGMYSMDPAEAVLARFFVDAGKLASDGNPVRSSVSSIYSKTDVESLSLLLLGLKNWNLGAYSDAGALLKEFASSQPMAPYEWIATYKSAARPFVEDGELYLRSKQLLQSVKGPESRNSAIATVKELRGQLQTGDDIRKDFDERIKTAEMDGTSASARVPSPTPPLAQVDPKVKASDESSLTAIEQTFAEQIKIFSPAVLGTGATAVKLSDPSARRRFDSLKLRAEWMVKFKAALIAGLSQAGYNQPVVRMKGGPTSGTFGGANATGLTYRLPYGTIPVAWTELAPSTIMQLAEYVRKKGAPKEVSDADWAWYIGVYACESGNLSVGRSLLLDAAQREEKYKDHIDVFFGETTNAP